MRRLRCHTVRETPWPDEVASPATHNVALGRSALFLNELDSLRLNERDETLVLGPNRIWWDFRSTAADINGVMRFAGWVFLWGRERSPVWNGCS